MSYEFIFNSTDPDNDSIMYLIDWGDKTLEWTEFIDSGVQITLNHSWNKQGIYIIKAKAKDIYDSESDWTEYTITMPRYKAVSNSLLLKFINRFPILNQFLQRLTRF
jgi:hypothetical protein